MYEEENNFWTGLTRASKAGQNLLYRHDESNERTISRGHPSLVSLGQLLAGRAGLTLITLLVMCDAKVKSDSNLGLLVVPLKKRACSVHCCAYKVHVPTHTYIQECICRWGFPEMLRHRKIPAHAFSHWANNIGPRPPHDTHTAVCRWLTFRPHNSNCLLKLPASRKHDGRIST